MTWVGCPMPSWRRVFHSREAWIESMAGQCPPAPFCMCGSLLPHDSHWWADSGGTVRRCAGVPEWPFDPDVPVWPPEDEALSEPREDTEHA